MAKLRNFPPEWIHTTNHVDKFLTVDGVDMWCDKCPGVMVTAMSLIGQNKFIVSHSHGAEYHVDNLEG